MKVILVPLSGAAGSEALLDAAFAVAERFGSHVTVLHVQADPAEALRATSMALPGSVRESVLEAGARFAAEGAEAARAAFDRYCAAKEIPIQDSPPAAAGPTAAWRVTTGRESIEVARLGRLADLIVLARPAQESPAPDTLETALMDSGRPILILPPGASDSIGGKVALGWNGSGVAANAAAAALPFLATAERVTVLTLRESATKSVLAGDLTDYLAWQGVAAEAQEFTAGSGSVGPALLAKARELGCDLLVLGGYGHSRARELFLGGVTRHVLAHADLPLLMLH
jgi:nucleotide-binding universal stress UspA family protein